MRTILHYTEAELKTLIAAAVTSQHPVEVRSVSLSVIEARDAHDRPIGAYVVSCNIECEESVVQGREKEKTLEYCKTKFDNTSLVNTPTPPPPERSMFDVFPGELRLDPGEPLAPQGAAPRGSGWYRVFEDITTERGPFRQGTIISGQAFSQNWLTWGVQQMVIVPCHADGLPLWPSRDAHAAY